MKKQNVMEEDWDTLIILDACRYDRFQKLYNDYLDGKLEKRDSGAGGTPEWLYKTFRGGYDYSDISYYSANPYVSSNGMNLLDISNDLYDWCASDLFNHVVDVWNKDKYWNDKYNTVLPEDLINAVEYFPGMNRRIIHFIQPHLPFIHPESEFQVTWHIKGQGKKCNIFERIRNYAFYDVLRMFVKRPVWKWKIRSIFNVPSLDGFEEMHHIGQEGRIEEFYEYSVRRVLKNLKNFVESRDEKIVITADHGECFGEYNTWGHKNENHNPILTTVPWFEVET